MLLSSLSSLFSPTMKLRHAARSVALTSVMSAALLPGLAAPAFAQPAAATTSKSTSKPAPKLPLPTQPAARKLVQEADASSKSSDFAAALSKLEEAKKLAPEWTIDVRMGEAQKNLNQSDDALETFHAVLANKKLPKAQATAVKQSIDSIEESTATIEVQVSEADADLIIDGKSLGKSPLAKPLRVPLGRHAVVIAKRGFVPFEQQVSLTARQVWKVTAALTAEITTGHVSIRERHDHPVRVVVDDKPLGEAPWGGDLAPGSHTIVLRGEQVVSEPQVLEVSAKGNYEIVIDAAARKGEVDVTVIPKEAGLWIDGKYEGSGRWIGKLDAGPHTVSSYAPGFQSQSQSITAEEGKVTPAVLTLAPKADGASAGAEGDPYKGIFVAADLVGYAPLHTPPHYGCENDKTGLCTANQKLDQLGAGLLVRVGNGYGVFAAEVAGMLFGEVQSLRNTYAGTNPPNRDAPQIDSSFAREELVNQYALGAFLGIGGRASTKTSTARLTAGADIGLSYHRIGLRRDVAGPVNYLTTDVDSYLAPALLLDTGVMIGATPGVKFRLGLLARVELPGSLSTEAKDRSTLVSGESTPRRLSIPSYPLVADKVQFFLGPTLGIQFGH